MCMGCEGFREFDEMVSKIVNEELAEMMMVGPWPLGTLQDHRPSALETH